MEHLAFRRPPGTRMEHLVPSREAYNKLHEKSGKPSKIKVFRLIQGMRHRGFEPRTT